MYIFDLKIGYTCNNNCIHCIISMNRDKLIDNNQQIDRSTKECFEQIDDAYDKFTDLGEKVSKVVITGGEPSIRKDLVELCEYIKKKGFDSIDIQTNGRGFADFDITETLVKTYSVKFIVAVHGPNAEIHDRVTRVKGSFDETIRALSNIRECQGFAIGKVVLSMVNYHYLPEIIEVYNRYGIRHINVAFPHSNVGSQSFFEYVPRYIEVEDAVDKCIEYSERNSMMVTFESFPFCKMGGHEDLVSELKIKDYSYFTSPVKSPVFDIKEKRPKAKLKSTVCGRCLFDNFCEGTWKEYINNYGEEEFIPVTEIGKFMSALEKIENSKKKAAGIL